MHFKLWLLLGATIAQAGPVVKRNNGGGEDNNTDGEVLSSFVGLSSSQVYTGNFGPQATKSFPPASVVGFPGHTPTGAEPFVVRFAFFLSTALSLLLCCVRKRRNGSLSNQCEDSDRA